MGRDTVGSTTVELRASAGVRWISVAERDARQVLREADAALYRAKDTERGRVEAAPTAPGPSTPEPAPGQVRT